MNNYEIIDEVGYEYDDVINKVISHTLKLEKCKNCEFSIIFISDEEIREMNKTYRGKDYVTDVISFALEDDQKIFNEEIRLLGDIFISIDQMKRQAEEYGHSEVRELSFLCVHGLLHLLGYDHENEEEETVMFGKQEKVLDEFEETKRKKRN